ncbi:MAG: hypothetical protein V4476_28075 [Pseudomonadota bacterium]
MATLKNIVEHPSPSATPEPSALPLVPMDAKRRRLVAALKAAEGLWKDRTDIPKDGVEYQEQLRAEWR